MSMCYRIDGRKALRVSVKGPPVPAAVKKSGMQNTHSSLHSLCSDSQSSQVSRASIKPQPPQEYHKETALPENVKARNISLIDMKRRDFLNFRKQLMQQQNHYIDMYAQLRDLEDRSAVPPGTAGEVRLLSVTDWPVHDLLLLTQNTTAEPHAEIKGVLGPKILEQLSSQLTGIPEEAQALGNELMQRRLELLEFMRSVLQNDSQLTYNGQVIEWQAKNAELDEETEKMCKLVLSTVKNFEATIIHCLDVAKIPWIDRDNMMKKIESLQKELSIYKTRKPDQPAKTIQTRNVAVNATDNKKGHEEEPHKERAGRASKELVAAAESKAAAARARCAELERQLNDTRTELATVQRRLENIKHLHHHHDSHSKKIDKVSKNGEVTIEVLSRQRNALELRVRELHEQATAKEQEFETRESELTARVDSLRTKLEDQILKRESLETQLQDSEKQFKEIQVQFNALQERSRELISLHRQKCVEYLPRKVESSGEDIDVWHDLQVTKAALGRVKLELELSRADKEHLLKSLAKIAHDGPENKMAEELLSREQKIAKMRNKIEELTENKKKMEENLATYENQLGALRMEVSVLRSLNSYESCNEKLPEKDLETEVFNLCLQVESLTREREALVTESATRALLLERHERCAELFAQVTRARRDLAAQLEGNGAQSVYEGAPPIHEVADSLSNMYITSADIWSALCMERARVVRLENTILAQSRALDRESAVRLKQERRRSQLERELIRTWAGSTKTQQPDNKEVEGTQQRS